MFNQVQHRYHYYEFIKLNAFLFLVDLKKINSKMKTQKFGFFFSFFFSQTVFLLQLADYVIATSTNKI